MREAITLTDIRLDRGLTQEQFASLLGLHRPNLSKYESGVQALPLKYLSKLKRNERLLLIAAKAEDYLEELQKYR